MDFREDVMKQKFEPLQGQTIDVSVFEIIFKRATDFEYMMTILKRHGIDVQMLVYEGGAYSVSKELTFPEALERALNKKFQNDKAYLRELEYQIFNMRIEIDNLKKQIPKTKEVELKDGTVMHVIDEEDSEVE
jgi:predicted  nucleic acid-binding Zn-ribbon protein